MNNSKLLSIILSIITLLVLLGSCAGSNLQNQDEYTAGSFVKQNTDHLILENGCVIVVSRSGRTTSLNVAVACPIIIQGE